MTFKEWLKLETATSTGDVASFQRISMPMRTRMFPEPVTLDLNKCEKCKKDKRECSCK